MDFDIAVKLSIYRTFAEQAIAPTSADIATTLNASKADIEAAFVRLYQKKLLVPEPDDPSRIRMAPPFSGIKTDFVVESVGKSYFANCVWDALGISAALHQDAVVRASDGHTREPMQLSVQNGNVLPEKCVIHFAVPAALWWKDVIYT